jgi:hypothetical protein
MKKLMLMPFLVVVFLFAYSQKQNVEFSVKTKDGNLLKEDADVYTFGPFKIIGLNTKSDYENFDKKVKNQSIVRKFEYTDEGNNEKSAILVVSTNEEKSWEDFLKAIGVGKITVNDKTFTLDQKEELKKYLKELKEKHHEEMKKSEEIRRSGVPQRRE